MMIVSPFFTFPNISWWAHVSAADVVIFDKAEHFQKMTGRNRYDIAGANNPIKLSIPLVNGRNQRTPMSDLLIYNGEDWQTRHWRTLESVYNRTPFFEHYAESLKLLFENTYTHLTDFNNAALHWARAQLKMRFEVQEAATYVKYYPAEITDLRSFKRDGSFGLSYYQVFEDRIGFQADLSILDLLFAEGPASLHKLAAIPY